MTYTDHLTDPTTRAAVVAELRRLAEVAMQAGNRYERNGLYRKATPQWALAAQRGHAADAVEKGATLNPHDRQHVESAVFSALSAIGGGA